MHVLKTRILILVALLLLVCLADETPAQPTERPNVLLILVDDLKPALGVYGDPYAVTPNIDALANRGMRFDRAYCNQAVCAPSRNHLMTSTRSTSSGIYDLGRNFRSAHPNAVTLTQHFMAHGYRAEGIGKVFHIGHGNVGDDASWSVPFLSESPIEYAMVDSKRGAELTREEAYFSNQMPPGGVGGLPRGAAWEVGEVGDDAYADGRIAREGVRRLQAASERDEPFFLVLGFTKPHLPFCAPEQYWELYDRDAFELTQVNRPPAGAPRYAPKNVFIEIGNFFPCPDRPEELPFDRELQRTLIHGYYAAMSYMDAQVGHVLEELDRLGLEDNTIVVLWGDHGYHLGHHGTWTKHTNYEQDNRIPILIAAPGVTEPGTHTEAFIETVDLYPTLAELAGLPAPAGPQPIDGLSQVPVLNGEADALRDHAYHAYPRGPRIGRAIRTARYRLVEWKEPGASPDTAEYELYDYHADPDETRNLAAERPAVLEELKAILAGYPEARR